MEIIYQNSDLTAYNKPAGINCDDFPKRVHRLDKDTSGIFLVAKNDKALEFLQKQFKERKVQKKYIALILGNLKTEQGEIRNFIGRSPSNKTKQKVFLPGEPKFQGKREAVTSYTLLQRFKDYDLIEIELKTGRKHQIRVQFSYMGHPLAGDKKYGFKNQLIPKGLKRHFLHASYLKIQLPTGEIKEFKLNLPEELEDIIAKLKTKS
jgi:23S rRNA pseudouridine1911/1915/1917 synthase